jgi:hypothetical protein
MGKTASSTTEAATGGSLTPWARRIGYVGLVVALVGLAGVVVAGGALAETAAGSGESATLASYDDPGTASLEINETSRSVADTELAPGGSTTVEVVVTTKDSLGSAELFEIEEQFSPAFGTVELLNMDPGGSAGAGPNNEEFLAIWSTTNETYTLTYEVTVPTDAESGDTFDIDGTVRTGDTSEQLPGATITVAGDVPEETTVSLEPTSDSAEPGDQTTFDVVVGGAGNGIGAYDMTVTSSDANVGEIVDYDLANDADTDNSQIAADGSSVDLDADLGSNTHEAAAEITVATVTVEAGEEGTSDFAFDSAGVDDTGGNSYTIDSTEGSTLTVADEPDPSEIVNLSLQPADSEVSAGAQQTYELVVEGAENGIGSYDTTITIGDTSVAEIVDARAFQTSAGLFDTVIAEDGSSVQFSGLVQFDAASQVTLAEIDVAAADTTGDTSLDLTVADIANDDASSYTVESATGATLTVSEETGPPALPEQDNAPQDLNDDGLFEDVNGDDRFSIVDVQIFFQNRDSDVVTNNPAAFNFDETDPPEVSIGDVQALFIAFTQSG